MRNFYNLRLLLTLCIGFGLSGAYGQDYTISYTGDYDTFVVPDGVSTIGIRAKGAQGASGQAGRVGGKGASMYGEFDVEPGSTLIIVVGGMGEGQSSGSNGGGGGGTFVVLDEGIGGPGEFTIASGPFADHTVTPLIVAGGGSGTRTSASSDGNPGVIGDMGTSGSGSGATGGGTPVTAPMMGGATSGGGWGSGGSGFVGNGSNDGSSGCGGKSFLNGAAGGSCGSCGHAATGGFGGGGQGRGCYGGGGGGGWSGGQGGRIAGGGGSYNIGENQDNLGGDNEEDGVVEIDILCIGLVPHIPETGVCLGEMLTLDVDSETGGVISWSGGVTDEEPFSPPPGTTTYYAYSSSDMDCAFEIDISASPVPDITAHSSVPTACEGALVTLWGEGGDSYEWTGDGDVTPIDSVAFVAEEGVVTYTVVGSYLGCEAEPVELTLEGAPQPEVVGVASPSEVCYGESYTVTGSGSGAVSYYWGGGIGDGDEITPESVGTFVHMVVGVSDEGCYDTAFVTVMVHEIPVVNAGMDITQCVGEDVILAGSGADEYSWSPAIMDGMPFPAMDGETTYTLTGTTDEGCEDTDEVIVTGVGSLDLTAVITDEYAPYSASIDLTVTGGSGSYSYMWSHGPTTQDVTGLTAGTYLVEVNDIGIEDAVCPAVDSIFVIRSYVGVEELNQDNVLIYPNPTTDVFIITMEGEFNYTLYSIQGAIITAGIANGQEEISMEELAKGTYLIEILQDEKSYTAKVVKE